MPTQLRKDGTERKPWRFSRGRKESIAYAQKVHQVLVNIGKKYRNKEAHMIKAIPRPLRGRKPIK